MAGSYFLGNTISRAGRGMGGGASTQPTTVFGRVVDIVLDENKILYDAKNNRLPIGSIIYQDIMTPVVKEATLPPAFPLTIGVKQYPLVNEIVLIITGPTPDFQENKSQVLSYYSSVVNIWGSPHHNALPTQGVDFEFPIGKDIPELKDINPLYPFPGDVLVEGRQGQSIRMGGYKSDKNPFTGTVNNGKPFTIISNGQIKTKNGIDPIVEDVNKDANSIYMMSDHIVNITPATRKQVTYDVRPQASGQYLGNQIVLNGGRITINAKEESALISAKEAIGLNARTLNFDATDYICIDGKTILLGEKARTAPLMLKQPVIRGLAMQNWAHELLDALQSVSVAMAQAVSVSGGAVTSLVEEGAAFQSALTVLRTNLSSGILSNKVYVE
jgi:hypothetical protein